MRILAYASGTQGSATALITWGGHAAAHTDQLEPGPLNTIALGPSWLDPDHLLNTFGLPGLLLIVFAESGLLIGFFLPGDSLLFTTGLLVTTGDLTYPLWLVCVLVALAAIIGDQVGYLFGRKVGPSLFKRPDSRLFKQENVEKAHEFFEKYGPKSLVLARFVPIVRTFTPIIAGVSRMNYRSFITFNIIGGVLWGVGVTLLGSRPRQDRIRPQAHRTDPHPDRSGLRGADPHRVPQGAEPVQEGGSGGAAGRQRLLGRRPLRRRW